MKQLLLNFYHKKLLFTSSLFIISLLLLFAFRFSILQIMGNVLIHQDEIMNSDVIVVLSGNATDRATEAAKLYHHHISKKIICTGGNQLSDLKILGLKELESDITKLKLLQLNVPDSAITVIHEGTSTFEESKIIAQYCQLHHIKNCIVVSSSFHTLRVSSIFKKSFKNCSTKLMIDAAPSTAYNLNNWWANEYGLLAVYDEYIKLLYYTINYGDD
jgi:uncharacterized SAM-binding protein YcdF (DUF218 family)